MSDDDIRRLTEEYRKEYSPLITFAQAAAIAHVPLATIYDWSSREKFDDFKSKRGRRVLLALEPFVRFLMSNNE